MRIPTEAEKRNGATAWDPSDSGVILNCLDQAVVSLDTAIKELVGRCGDTKGWNPGGHPEPPHRVEQNIIQLLRSSLYSARGARRFVGQLLTEDLQRQTEGATKPAGGKE